MAWNAYRYAERLYLAERTETEYLPAMLRVAQTAEGKRAVLDVLSARIRKAEIARNVDLMAPHREFNSYAPDDETAFPCRCWIAGRENRGADSTDCLHPNEFLEGVQARYEYENNI